MGTVIRPQPSLPRAPVRSPFRIVDAKRRSARLHLLTYVVGSALFWVLWAAVSVAAETWYWWALLPLACWTLALWLHLRHVSRT